MCHHQEPPSERMLPPRHSQLLVPGGTAPCLMQFIDTLDREDLLLTGEVKWRPLLEENAQSILKVPSSTYNDAGL
ncbi:ubiquinol-cytochrome-c reductase complex assembly factor 1-like isoform X4 [Oncorhynchus keta]|uniref:ubiquinol-cytochrome-c reductase complex assembly factor 1-like isoform X4 n=1 Tax=Oncorhynchus keta TaxID=8018 RepID=UPI0015F95D14|nr:ubiquinol-cytochrome-c reductase complex assembly factor 1-like isoform X4 [Oncorhynchus keta]